MKKWIQRAMFFSFLISGFTMQAWSADQTLSGVQLMTSLSDTIGYDSPQVAGDTQISNFLKDHKNEIETECLQVVYQWGKPFAGRACITGHQRCAPWNIYKEYRIVINVYCVPRPESQKFIKSVELACEKNPTVECVKLAPQFDLIAPTTSRNIDRP